MTDEERDAELRSAIDDRMNARREAARRKRENTSRFYATKNPRRAAGLERRHARKINRTESQS